MAMWGTAAVTCLVLAFLSVDNADDRFWRRWLRVSAWLWWRGAMLAFPLGATFLSLAVDPPRTASGALGSAHGLVVAAASFVAFSGDVRTTGSGPLGEVRRVLLIANTKLRKKADDHAAGRIADLVEHVVHSGNYQELVRVARAVVAALTEEVARHRDGAEPDVMRLREFERLRDEMTSSCDVITVHESVGNVVVTIAERDQVAYLLSQQLIDAIGLLRWTSTSFPRRSSRNALRRRHP